MAGRKIRRNGRSAPVVEPFATIRADLLGSAAYRSLSGHAMRLHLLFEASFNPNRELFLPQAKAVAALGMSYSTVNKAYAELTHLIHSFFWRTTETI